MKTKVYCFDCCKILELEHCGDLGQYTGDTLICPCGESALVPRFSDKTGWGLYPIAFLLAPNSSVK